MFKESKGSVQFKDGLRRRLIRETKVIIVFIPRVSDFDFVFSKHSNMMMWLFAATQPSAIRPRAIPERL